MHWGKGRKNSHRLHWSACAYLTEYLAYRPGVREHEPLWIKASGTGLSMAGIRQIVRRRARQAGVPEPGIHSFRGLRHQLPAQRYGRGHLAAPHGPRRSGNHPPLPGPGRRRSASGPQPLRHRGQMMEMANERYHACKDKQWSSSAPRAAFPTPFRLWDFPWTLWSRVRTACSDGCMDDGWDSRVSEACVTEDGALGLLCDWPKRQADWTVNLA